MKRYLITAIGGDIGSTVARCMSLEYGKGCLCGCDISEYVQGRDYVGHFFLAPPYCNEREYIDFVLDVSGREGITFFIPMTEPEIKLCDLHREELEAAGLNLLINRPDVLRIGFSKYQTAKLLKKNGILAPDTWYPDEREKPDCYPVIVKEDSDCGSKKVIRADSREAYSTALEGMENPVIQQYIGTEAEEYTVGVFSDGKQSYEIAFKRKLGPGGMSVYVEYCQEKAISELARRVASAFGLRGCLNFQMRKHRGQYYIFEVNPRISSTVGFRYLLNFKDIIWWLNLAGGEAQPIHYVPENASAVGIRTMGERIFKGGGGTAFNV